VREAFTKKGGENLNGSGKEKGGNEEDGDQEEVGTLYGLGDRMNLDELSIRKCYSVTLTVERGHPLLGGGIPPSRYHNHLIIIILSCEL
jgi:hypothetical protein